MVLLTHNLADTEKFYTGIMGLPEVIKSESVVAFRVGTTLLKFEKSEKKNPIYHIAFNIPNNKTEEALIWFSSKIPILYVSENEKIIDFEDWNARSFYFMDNNGNILECIARFDLENAREKEFNSASLLNISEIGIPVDEVILKCENLIAKRDHAYFAKQEPFDYFAALGDDHGLLIFVKSGRNWFPTDQPALQYPIKVKVKEHEKVVEHIF